jgi:hypothetical protein
VNDGFLITFDSTNPWEKKDKPYLILELAIHSKIKKPMSRKSKEEIAAIYKQMQEYICQALEAGDGAGSFKADNWVREEGGGGQTRIFQDGAIVEKGGVAFSAVHGPTPKKISDKLGLESGVFCDWCVYRFASLQSHGPHHPHEYPILRDGRWYPLVWWRDRFDAPLHFPRRCGLLPPEIKANLRFL